MSIIPDAQLPTDNKPQYRVFGKWIGGCEWQSKDAFESEELAWAWWSSNQGPTPSENIRVEKVR